MARRRKISMAPDDSLPEGPVRTCIGCRKRTAKSELLRVIAGSDEETGRPVAWPDPDGTAPGRGAHLHPTPGCYDLAVRRKAFSRALFPKSSGVEGGLSSAPVAEHLGSPDHQQRPTERDWSSSS